MKIMKDIWKTSGGKRRKNDLTKRKNVTTGTNTLQVGKRIHLERIKSFTTPNLSITSLTLGYSILGETIINLTRNTTGTPISDLIGTITNLILGNILTFSLVG